MRRRKRRGYASSKQAHDYATHRQRVVIQHDEQVDTSNRAAAEPAVLWRAQQVHALVVFQQHDMLGRDLDKNKAKQDYERKASQNGKEN